MSKQTKPLEPEFSPGQKVWTSKWALSEGIKAATFVKRTWATEIGCFDILVDGEDEPRSFWAKSIHATEESARAASNSQRNRRIKSLQKQIFKLEQLRF